MAASGEAQEPLLANEEGEEPVEPEMVDDVSLAQIVKEFSVMGWVAFGGPTAHLGFFQKVPLQLRRAS